MVVNRPPRPMGVNDWIHPILPVSTKILGAVSVKFECSPETGTFKSKNGLLPTDPAGFHAGTGALHSAGRQCGAVMS